jgi:hypothetical protein
MTAGTWLIQKGALLSSLGVSDGYVDQLGSHLEQQMDSATAGHIWLFKPSAHGVVTAQTVWAIDLRSKALEIGGNALDDDCDGQIDESDG